jgi:hypothetical protein
MIGEKVADLYTLEDIFELVPGVWTVELWDGERKLLTQSFTLETPAAPPRPDAVVTPKTGPPPKAPPAPAAKTMPAPAPKTVPKAATPAKPESAPDNF